MPIKSKFFKIIIILSLVFYSVLELSSVNAATVVNKQLSFTAGEVSPALYGRADLQKFDSACRTLLNMIVHVEGGASNRPGLEFIGAVHDSSETTRLIRFRFNTEQTYILEFSDFIFRVIKDQAYVMNDAVSITAVTKADPVEVTIGAHSLIVGQEVFVSDVGGMVELTDGFYRINSVTATTITLEDIFGTNIDSSAFTAYTSGGTVEAIPIFDTFWPQADLARLKFTQSADVLTVVHPDHNSIYDITRTDHDVWTVTAVDFTSGVGIPAGFSATPNPGSGTPIRDYVVTAIDDDTKEESLPSTSNNATNDLSVTGNKNDCTWTLVTGASKYNVYCDDNASGIFGFIGQASTNNFEDNFITPDYNKTPPETRSPVFVSEGFVITGATQADPCVLTITAGARTPAVGDQVDISEVVGMTELNGNTYFVKAATSTTIDLEDKEGTSLDSTGFTGYGSAGVALVSEQDNSPRCVTYHQQRRIFAGPDNKPSTFFTSRIGLFSNMNVSAITQDDDAITFNVVADDVNEIRDMKSQKDLFLFTSSGVWRIVTGESLVFSADNISAEEQESWGVSNVQALKIGQSFLYVQDGERVVRDLQDTLEANGFSGDELTILAKHMFKERQIVEWAYARDPDSIIWCVMDDGTVNALTYLRKHQIWAWTHHTTDGLFKSVEAIPEATSEYGVYFAIERTIEGTTGSVSTMQYVERLHNRNLFDIKDSFFVDSGLSLDVPITITGATVASPVVLTLVTTTLTNGDFIDIAEVVGMTELNGMRYKVANKTGSTVELTDSDDNNIDGTAFTAYISDGEARLAVTTVSGLGHLEGEDVSVLADGGTDANPLDPDLTAKTVSSGSITIANAASRIHVGLPYTSDLETIGVDLTSISGLGGALARIKSNPIVKIRVQDTAGLRMGPNEDELEPYKPQGVQANEAQGFLNDVLEKSFLPVWNHDGTVFIRQIDPLPMSILNIMPEVLVIENP